MTDNRRREKERLEAGVRELQPTSSSAQLPSWGLLSKKEAVENGWSRDFLDRLIESKAIFVVKNGENGQERIPVSELQRFIEEGRARMSETAWTSRGPDNPSRTPDEPGRSAGSPKTARVTRSGSPSEGQKVRDALRADRRKRR